MNSTIMLSALRRRRPRTVRVRPEKTAPPLHAMVAGVGVERMGPGDVYSHDGNLRGASQLAILQVTLAGEGGLEFEGRAYRVGEGQAMLLYVPHAHRYFLPPGGRWKFFYLTLYGREIVRHWRYAVQRLGPVPDLPPDGPLFQGAARVCTELLRNPRRNPPQVSMMAYEIAMLLLEEVRRRGHDQRARQRPPGIDRAVAFAAGHLAEPIGVDDLAAAAGLSRYHFSRLFAACLGVPPGEYLVRERMRRAVTLLQTTGEPVKRIAADCGYPDPNYFCRAFRYAIGISPGSFRQGGQPG